MQHSFFEYKIHLTTNLCIHTQNGLDVSDPHTLTYYIQRERVKAPTSDFKQIMSYVLWTSYVVPCMQQNRILVTRFI